MSTLPERTQDGCNVIRQSTAVDVGCQQQRRQREQWRLTVAVAIDGRQLQMVATAIG
jgi:hypothetical protein